MTPDLAASPVAGRLLACLERRMFVAPTLRNLIVALPDRPAPSDPQAAAVVALVVLNAWLCLGERALELLRELDQVTGDALRFHARDERIVIAEPAAAERARLTAESLATKLGFSPGHRTKVAQVVSDCVRAVATRTVGVLDLRVVPGRQLVLEVRAEPPADGAERLELGSAPIWSPRRLDKVALAVDVRDARGGATVLTARFGPAAPAST